MSQTHIELSRAKDLAQKILRARTIEIAQLRTDLQEADSRAVKAKVLLSNLLWSLADIELSKVKFEQAKGKAWRHIRGEDG